MIFMQFHWRYLLSVILFSLFVSSPASAQGLLAADLVEDGQAIDLSSPRYRGFFKELKLVHGFTQEELDKFFPGVTILKRVVELMDKQWEARPYFEYRPRLINNEVIAEGRKKLRLHKELLDKIEEQYKVEREIVVAVWGVETKYGVHTGEYNTFQTLNTLFNAYPRRRIFFRQQLIHYLLLCKENKVDPLSIKGSYAGAIGQTQFIPSSLREYAIDFDQDGRRDVWDTVPDILASIANYLHRYHWEFGVPVYWELGNELKDRNLVAAYKLGKRWYIPWQYVEKNQGVVLPVGSYDKKVSIVGFELEDGGTRYIAGSPNFYAITRWNNSSRYAMVIAELAEEFKK
jgi:membrane-bound lytic murein transglycosylase B